MSSREHVSSEKASMTAMCQNLRDLQVVLLDQIMSASSPNHIEVAETLEDVANAYLDAAELISARYLSTRREERPSLSETASGSLAEG